MNPLIPRARTLVFPALVLATLAAAARAQESASESRFAAIKPAMTELQKGTWSMEAAKSVLDALLKDGHVGAASWWLAATQEAILSKKLHELAPKMLAPYYKKCETQGASAEDRKLALKVTRHLESLVASKNFDEAKKVAATAKVLQTFAPDATVARSLEAAEAKIGKGNQDPSNLARQQKQFAEMQDAIAALYLARIERLLVEYEAAGCKTGRTMLKKAIAGAKAAIGEDVAKTMLARLDAAAHRVEPTSVLTLAVRPIGTAAYRDGKETVKIGLEPVELEVLGGDLIQLEVPRYSQGIPGGDNRAFHVLLTSARIGTRELDARHWFLNKAGDPKIVDPALVPTEVIRVKATDDTLKRNFDPKPYEKNGAFIGADGSSARATAVDDERVRFEEEFAEKKLKPLWLGAITEKCVLVLKVPE